MIAEAGRDLPGEVRAARTDVEIIGDEQPGVADAEAAAEAADAVPDVAVGGYPADCLRTLRRCRAVPRL